MQIDIALLTVYNAIKLYNFAFISVWIIVFFIFSKISIDITIYIVIVNSLGHYNREKYDILLVSKTQLPH